MELLLSFLLFIFFIIFFYMFINKYYENFSQLLSLKDYIINEKYKLVIYFPYGFNFESGGIVILVYFSQLLNELLDYDFVYLYDVWGTYTEISGNGIYFKNFIKNLEFNDEFDYEKTIGLYAEGIGDNPLNVKYCIRWILLDINLTNNRDVYKGWNHKDLVYYFNKEKKIIENPDKIGTIYKQLTLIYLNPSVKKYNFNERHGWCHLFRKKTYDIFEPISPEDSFHIDSFNLTLEEHVDLFNKYKYLVCYDAQTFYSTISLICGCITIVYPLNNLSRDEYLKTSWMYEYLQLHKIDRVYGLAYGIEELEYAEKTIDKAPELIENIIKSINDKNLLSFLFDIYNIKKKILKNTVYNNYII